jgi:hypothetical protein
MPVPPSFKIQVSNPNAQDLSGFPFPIRLPQSLWQHMRGTDPWDADELDNMNLGSDGYIIKWPELDDFWALAKLDTAYPEDIYAYCSPGAGCDPQDVFPIWRELLNEDIDNEVVGTLEEGMTIVSHSTNITGNHLIIVVNNSNGQAFVVHRNYFTNETYYTYFGDDNPSTSGGIHEKMSFAIKDGYFEIKWFDEEGGCHDFISGLSLQEATVLVSGNFLNGRIYSTIQELPEGVTYDFYNYDTEEQYPWEPGEAPWDTSSPSIDNLSTPEGVFAGETFHVEAITTDIESLDFIFGSETYPGVDEGEGVFSAEIQAPMVEEKTSLVLYAQSGDTTASKAIQIYPAVPVETRVKFFQNNSEISTLVMETGQTAFIDVLVEKKEDEWEEVGYQLEASIVSFDGQEFEEMAVCNVDGRTARVEADLPIGVFFLQTVIQLDPPLSYERVQRLKLKVVVDRK